MDVSEIAIVLLSLSGALLFARCWYLWYRYVFGFMSFKLSIPHLMSVMSLTALSMMDGILTSYALSHGAVELNPFLVGLPPIAMLSLKLLSMIPFYCFSLVKMRTDLSIAVFSTMIALNALYLSAVVRSVFQLLLISTQIPQ